MILDPPGYGHGPQGEPWKLVEQLGGLLDVCWKLTAGNRLFLLLTCHSGELAAAEGLLKAVITEAPQLRREGKLVASDMLVTSAAGGRLHCGATARWSGSSEQANVRPARAVAVTRPSAMNDRTITSPHNTRIKDAARLRVGRQRQKQQRALIDGAREISRALDGDVRLIDVFVCDELCQSEECRRLVARADDANCTLWHVSPDVFERLAFGGRTEGVVAVAETPERTLDALHVADGGLVAVACGLEKPGNVGAILRSADAAGVSAVIVADGGTDLFNPNCIRASLGTVFTQQVAAATSERTRAGWGSGVTRSWLRGWTGARRTTKSTIAATSRWCWEAKRPGSRACGLRRTCAE